MPDYSDVKHLVFKGFIPQPLTLGGVPLVLKSLSPTEMEIVLLSAGGNEGPLSERSRRAAYIGHALWMIEGRSVLSCREDFIDLWLDEVWGFGTQVLSFLYQEVNMLNSRAANAFKLLEAFSYTAESRMRWKALNGLPPWSAGGIEGAQGLGLNSHQEFWAALNMKEDLHERFESEYSLAKFVVSPHISKQAASQLKGQDEFRQKEEQSRRERVLNEVDGRAGEGPKIARTTEELLDQMNRWVRGEKDEHDLEIEKLEQRIRDEIAEKERIYQEYLEKAKDLEKDDVLAASSEVVSAEEMERRMKESIMRRRVAAERIKEQRHQVSSLPEEKRRAIMRNMDSEESPAAPAPVDTRPVANPRAAAYRDAPSLRRQPAAPVESQNLDSGTLASAPKEPGFEDGGTNLDPDAAERRMRELGLLK